ncbi:MAG: hypothetical protein LBP78_01365 [Acidaminococcales bacterium]|jgi:hypothetical protein|nr:hypothetical protein [Acidaminococcales bacterium]
MSIFNMFSTLTALQSGAVGIALPQATEYRNCFLRKAQTPPAEPFGFFRKNPARKQAKQKKRGNIRACWRDKNTTGNIFYILLPARLRPILPTQETSRKIQANKRSLEGEMIT